MKKFEYTSPVMNITVIPACEIDIITTSGDPLGGRDVGEEDIFGL